MGARERTNKDGKYNLVRVRSFGRSRSVGRSVGCPQLSYGMTGSCYARAIRPPRLPRCPPASVSVLMILFTSSFFRGGRGRGDGVRTCDARDSSVWSGRWIRKKELREDEEEREGCTHIAGGGGRLRSGRGHAGQALVNLLYSVRRFVAADDPYRVGRKERLLFIEREGIFFLTLVGVEWQKPNYAFVDVH